MKKFFALAVFALLAVFYSSCTKNDNPPHPSIIPDEVVADFEHRFPSATRVEWEYSPTIIKVEFVMDRTDYDAWFENSGSWRWFRTEKDVNPSGKTLPAPVSAYISNNYPGWRIDDIDYIQTPLGSHYEIELEKRGEMDVTIFIKEDGTVIDTFTDHDLPDNYVAPSVVPAAVRSTFTSKYPKAIRVKWEMQGTIYEAEFINDNKKHEALFKQDGTWIMTEIDLNPRTTTLPAAVTNYITTNYAGYSIDDIDFIQLPADEFYEIELEKKSLPDVTIFIREDGTIVTFSR